MKEVCSKYKVEINEIGKKEIKRKLMKLKICFLKIIKIVFIYDLKKKLYYDYKINRKIKICLINLEGREFLFYILDF